MFDTSEKTVVRLDDFFVPGPVDRGVYVASGSRMLIPRVLDGLVNLLWRQSVTPLQAFSQTPGACGDLEQTIMGGFIDESQSDPFVSSRLWRRPSSIGQFIWVDSGNSFDACYMSRAARIRGLEPIKVLRTVKVRRPFTIFQLNQTLDHIPKPALWAYPVEKWDEQKRGSFLESKEAKEPEERRLSSSPFKKRLQPISAFWWTPLVILSNPLELFQELGLPEADLQQVYHDFLQRLAFLKQRAIVLILLVDHKITPEWRNLVRPLLSKACRVTVPIHVRQDGSRNERLLVA